MLLWLLLIASALCGWWARVLVAERPGQSWEQLPSYEELKQRAMHHSVLSTWQ